VRDLAIHLRALPLAQGKRFLGGYRMGLESHLSDIYPIGGRIDSGLLNLVFVRKLAIS
jgi:hypothetical protein